MKISIGGHLEPYVVGTDSAQKMVPLEDLVQQDAVEEAAERKAQEMT
jgi:hypothetical protein